ncbi:MAG TPA: hypothetical protein VHC97_00815 [Thermoanaerobaculia bacterium]|jgi:hypothetical protein|nr:hypothetical protein [Thermoanaerobaculia bacterium]
MISQNPEDPKAQDSSNDNAANTTPDPRRPIEVASGGSGTTTDPSDTDKRPPGCEGGDLDYFA